MHHIAQLNIAALREPLTSPLLADFVAALEPVNALADASPGFVWRLQTEDGDATAVRPFDDEAMIVNLSVWESVETLSDFVFRTGHTEVMRQRRRWFEVMSEAYTVLWWVPAGEIPTVEEAARRLNLLRRNGPGPEAFTLRETYPPSSVGLGDGRAEPATGEPARQEI